MARCLFTTTGRPWFVLSDDGHPFHGEEYVVAGITTTDRADAIRIEEDAWNIGSLPRTSYVSPWFLTTVKHADVHRGVGAVDQSTVESILAAVSKYVT